MDEIKYIKKVPRSKKVTLTFSRFKSGQTIEIFVRQKPTRRNRKLKVFDMSWWAGRWAFPFDNGITSTDTESFTGRSF